MYVNAYRYLINEDSLFDVWLDYQGVYEFKMHTEIFRSTFTLILSKPKYSPINSGKYACFCLELSLFVIQDSAHLVTWWIYTMYIMLNSERYMV